MTGDFMSGAIAMAYLVIGLFFLRFWRQTRDRLFAIFAIALWVLALNRATVAVVQIQSEDSVVFYVVRLVAYSLIVIGILDKNRPKGQKPA